jgi:GNAT superfamily N-acetyltransferase
MASRTKQIAVPALLEVQLQQGPIRLSSPYKTRTETHAIALRQAVTSDAGTLAALHSESWRSSYRGILSDDYLDGAIFDERTTYWQESLNAPEPERRYILIAEQAGEVLAFVSVYLDEEPKYGALLHNLHVRPHLKGQGLGKLLMNEAAEWTLAQNINQMHLWVFEANNEARRFYEALGGKTVEEKLTSVAGNVERNVLRYFWDDLTQVKERV